MTAATLPQTAWEYRVSGPDGLEVNFGVAQVMLGAAAPFQHVIEWTVGGETTTTVPEKVHPSLEHAKVRLEKAVRRMVCVRQDSDEIKPGYSVSWIRPRNL